MLGRAFRLGQRLFNGIGGSNTKEFIRLNESFKHGQWLGLSRFPTSSNQQLKIFLDRATTTRQYAEIFETVDPNKMTGSERVDFVTSTVKKWQATKPEMTVDDFMQLKLFNFINDGDGLMHLLQPFSLIERLKIIGRMPQERLCQLFASVDALISLEKFCAENSFFSDVENVIKRKLGKEHIDNTVATPADLAKVADKILSWPSKEQCEKIVHDPESLIAFTKKLPHSEEFFDNRSCHFLKRELVACLYSQATPEQKKDFASKVSPNYLYHIEEIVHEGEELERALSSTPRP